MSLRLTGRQLLGSGSYGCVWEESTHLGAAVAVKIYRSFTRVEAGGSPSSFTPRVPEDAMDELECELRVMAQLDHMNIMKPLGVTFIANHPAMIMPLAECSLDVAVGRVDAVSVLNISVQLLCALEHLHSHDILHCDIKPANVMVMSSGIVKLSDFGMARTVNESRETSKEYSRPYRAPEIMTGEKHATKGTDVWAMGALIYELVTGKRFTDGLQCYTDGLGDPVYDDMDLLNLVCVPMTREIAAREGEASVSDCGLHPEDYYPRKLKLPKCISMVPLISMMLSHNPERYSASVLLSVIYN